MKTTSEALHLVLVVLSLGILGCETTGTGGVSNTNSESVENVPNVEEVVSETKTGTKPVVEFKSDAPKPKTEMELAQAETPATATPSSPPETSTPPPSTVKSSGDETKPTKSATPSSEPKVEEGTPAPVTIPSTSSFTGRVVLINLKKNFVVMDFDNGKVPPIRSELGVYRNSQFVGSIRITPPINTPLASADILTGTLRRGDDVR